MVITNNFHFRECFLCCQIGIGTFEIFVGWGGGPRRGQILSWPETDRSSREGLPRPRLNFMKRFPAFWAHSQCNLSIKKVHILSFDPSYWSICALLFTASYRNRMKIWDVDALFGDKRVRWSALKLGGGGGGGGGEGGAGGCPPPPCSYACE